MSAGRGRHSLLLQPISQQHRDRTNDVAVAVIGCGNHSTTSILPSLRHAPVRLIAVCDLDSSRAEAAKAQFGAELAVCSVDELLARARVDAVLVVGPPELHVSAGIAALQSGHHVFVEKPPGTRLADAEKLRQAARAANRQVMVGFMKRHASAYRLVRQVISSADFGQVTSLEMTYAHWPVEGLRTHLTDMSIHALDTACWLLGEPVKLSVFKRPIGLMHPLALMIEHASGAVSQLHLSAFQPGVQERLVVTGQQEVVKADGLALVEYTWQAAGTDSYQANTRLTSSWAPEFSLPDRENDVLFLQGYAAEMISFAECIRGGLPASASIDDGVRAMRLIETIVSAPDGLVTVEL